MAYRYNRINWQNKPNTATPISAANLNKMDKGIKDCDDAIGDLALLNTNNKTDLVSAINEQNDKLARKTSTTSFADLLPESEFYYTRVALTNLANNISNHTTGIITVGSGGPAYCALLFKQNDIAYGGILLSYGADNPIFFTYFAGTYAVTVLY